MFRGLNRKDHLISLALIGLITMGATRAWLAHQSAEEVRISGPVAVHEPGMLESPLPATSEGPTQLSVPTVPAASTSPMRAMESGRININLADEAALEALPGIGPSKASSIIEYRRMHGPFRTVANLTDVSGIGAKTLEKLEPMVTVGTIPAADPPLSATPAPPVTARPAIPPNPGITQPVSSPVSTIVRLNTATSQELEDLDGVGPAKAAAILQYRASHGAFRSIDELMSVKGIGPVTFERNRHRLALN